MVVANVEWLADGSLPVYDVRCPFWYAIELPGGWEWEQRGTQTHRLIIPLYESTWAAFLAFLAKPLPEGQGVMVSFRSLYELEGVWYVCVGVAVTDEPLAGIELAPDLTLVDVVRAVGAFQTEHNPPADPRLQGLWWEHRINQEWRTLLAMAEGLPEAPDEAWFAENWTFPPHPKRTLAEVVANRGRHLEYKAHLEERDRAMERARHLLVGCLNDEQRAEFERRKQFRVAAADGYTYLITYRSHAGVWRLDGKRFLANCCIIPKGDTTDWFQSAALPIYDLMLAQKLMIEGDLKGFLETANIQPVPLENQLPREETTEPV